MHELSIMMEVIRIVEDFTKDNSIEHINSIVLEVGELSSVVPDFMIEYFPIVVSDKPMFRNTKLDFVVIPGRGICDECGKPYEIIKNNGVCPICGSNSKTLISGREFSIRGITAANC
ncbi:MAG: hydrogenase maturation nickel metallochaperone HypA [Clostridiales bacterium]|nr:hydrogenase maturation nickel metallochaperone HypA [Clostridiales bacterium]